MNYFEVFELPENLNIDAQDLERRFYALSRKWHPDRFARASAEDQQRALDMAAVLNDAYRTLREPVVRTEYLLTLRGLATDGVSKDAVQKVPPELLEEVFELNMALEEWKMGDTDALPALQSAQAKFGGMLAQSDRDLENDFAQWDAAHDPRLLERLRSRLHHRKYIANLVRDTGQALEKHVSD